MNNKNPSLNIGLIFLALAVMIGAFGAHGLEKMSTVTERGMNVFETGVRYHFYHAIGLIMLGLFEIQSSSNFKLSRILAIVGILFFSFNCYLYAVSGIKTFAMIVPLGGVSFIVFWLSWFVQYQKSK